MNDAWYIVSTLFHAASKIDRSGISRDLRVVESDRHCFETTRYTDKSVVGWHLGCRQVASWRCAGGFPHVGEFPTGVDSAEPRSARTCSLGVGCEGQYGEARVTFNSRRWRRGSRIAANRHVDYRVRLSNGRRTITRPFAHRDSGSICALFRYRPATTSALLRSVSLSLSLTLFVL